MNQTAEKTWWPTSPKFLGPLSLIGVLLAVALVGIFVDRGMISEAILAFLSATILLLLSLVGLLIELIRICRRIETTLESRSQ